MLCLYAIVALGMMVVLANYDFAPGTIFTACAGYVVVVGAALIFWRWSQYADLVYLGELKGLTQLLLDNAPVTDAGLLAKLETLDLHATPVTDARLVHLAGLTKLNSLYLNDTAVTDAGLVHLSGLKGLTYLSLRNTQVTDAGVAKLQKALPNCQIDH